VHAYATGKHLPAAEVLDRIATPCARPRSNSDSGEAWFESPRARDTEPNGAPILNLATSTLGPTSAPYDLSTRDVEILQLVAAGNSNKEIGEALNRSALTIKSHLSRIGRELGTGDRARMVIHAMRASIIS